jgi:MazG family protein
MAEGERVGDGSEEVEAFRRVVALVRRLRGPGGCPWDRAQTHASLRRYALEEAREVALAATLGDPRALAEELGDLVLQVLLHAAIAEEAGTFSLREVLDGLADKLVRRHPHVFGGAPAAAGPEEVARRWEAQKAAEGRGGDSIFARRPDEPWEALAEARELGERAARVGLDWDGAEAVHDKLREEEAEVAAAWREDGPDAARRVEEEFGDYLFTAVQWARHLGVDPEAALLAANAKFRRRAQAVEAVAAAEGRNLGSLRPEERERLWDRLKAAERMALTADGGVGAGGRAIRDEPSPQGAARHGEGLAARKGDAR